MSTLWEQVVLNGFLGQHALQSDRSCHLGPVMFTSVSRATVERYVSRHTLNSAGRKRAPQGASGIQAPVRRELQRAILHHQLGRQECQSISPSGVGGDRAQVEHGVQLQQVQAAVAEAYQLLRAIGGDGRTGTSAAPRNSARNGGPEGRSGGQRTGEVSRSTERGSATQRGTGAAYF